MKKLLIVTAIVAILITTNTAFAGGAVKLGFDFPGDHKVSAFGESGTEDVEAGFSLTGEFFGAINKNVDLGGGLTWQFPRSQKDYPADFYFIPLYAMIRVRSDSQETAPYFIGQLGYNLIYDGDTDYTGIDEYKFELEGGLYYGIGGGVILKNRFLIEILYSVNKGTGSNSYYNVDIDVEYSKFSLLFGVNF